MAKRTRLLTFLGIFVVLSIVEGSLYFVIEPVMASFLIVVAVTLSLGAALLLVKEIRSITVLHVVMLVESILQAYTWWSMQGGDRIALDLLVTVVVFPFFVLLSLFRIIVELTLLGSDIPDVERNMLRE